MTDQEINQVIAEACGWTEITTTPFTDAMKLHFMRWFGLNPKTKQEEPLPDYCSDLNAMHEAVATLDHVSQTTRYGEYLCQILDFEMSEPWTMHCVVSFSQAEARECAEAFLRTIGKWTEV